MWLQVLVGDSTRSFPAAQAGADSGGKQRAVRALGHHGSQEMSRLVPATAFGITAPSQPPPTPGTIEQPWGRAEVEGDGGPRLGQQGSRRGHGQMPPLATLAGGRKPLGMLLGRDNQRAQVEARSLLLTSTSQGTGVPKPPASPGTAQTPKTQPREGQRRPGAQHPAAGPQAGISPPSCDSRKKYSENQGESTEQMRAARARREETCSK